MQNGFIESFNGRFSDELLNETLLSTLEARRGQAEDPCLASRRQPPPSEYCGKAERSNEGFQIGTCCLAAKQCH